MSHHYAPAVAEGLPSAGLVEPRQYDLRGILGVWAVAAVPMAVLA